jgi:hypothetical protein
VPPCIRCIFTCARHIKRPPLAEASPRRSDQHVSFTQPSTLPLQYAHHSAVDIPRPASYVPHRRSSRSSYRTDHHHRATRQFLNRPRQTSLQTPTRASFPRRTFPTPLTNPTQLTTPTGTPHSDDDAPRARRCLSQRRRRSRLHARRRAVHPCARCCCPGRR